MSRQMTFRDGRWIDTWNDLDTTVDPPSSETHTWADAVLMDESLCGCADLEQITAAMVAYLTQDGILHRPGDDLGSELLINLADTIGLAGHGTSLNSCWLTDAGRAWLALVEAGR